MHSTPAPTQAPDRIQGAREKLFRNISPPDGARGAVIASPSRANPDYYFNWIRDAALVMSVVVDIYEHSTDPQEKASLKAQLLDYAAFSRRLQATPAPSGSGEPKSYVNGQWFTGPWGRPQHDGPALRAITLCRFARLLLDEGEEALVREKLYGSSLPAESVIKADLEATSRVYREKGFDYWEEVRGLHFTTRMVQRRSLLDGAALAERLGDPGAAAWYREQAKNLDAPLESHWDDSKGIIEVTRERDGGVDYKASGLDAAVILGVLHGETNGSFSVVDDRVIATAHQLKQAFQRLYPINGNGRPGVAIGRYPEDRYDGQSSGGQGNPWVLTTNAFAEYDYRLAKRLVMDGVVRISARNVEFYRALLGDEADRRALVPGQDVRVGTPLFSKIFDGLVAAGDAFVARVVAHGFPDGALSEQINRYTGFMTGAHDLTWNYASMLTALWSRREVLEARRQPASRVPRLRAWAPTP